MKRITGVVAICSVVSVVSACGGTAKPGVESNATEAPKEPFTLNIHAAGVTADEFNDRFKAALAKKFPHITIQYNPGGTGQTVKDLVTTGNIPDIIRTAVPTLKADYLDLQLGEDLNPYVKKYKYDLKRFNNVFIDEIVDAGRTSELYGLPVPPYFPHVLYYNKDLFNRFGVPYPKDGMSWDEIYEIAKKMTRVDSGVKYRGFTASHNSILRDNVFSHPILDPSLDKLADSEKWKTIFNNFKRFYEIANNGMVTAADDNKTFAEGTSAMNINLHSVYLIIPKEINWDIVSYPTLAGAPKLMAQRGPAYWSISKTSKHKDEAFQVMMEMLSDDIQMEDAKKGIPTTLVKKEIKDALGKDHAIYSTKNMKAISYYEPIPYTAKRKAGLLDVPGTTQTTLLNNAFNDFVMDKTDVNTALKSLDEKLKIEVDKEKAK